MSPNDRWLERVCLHLVDRGDWRGVVRIVERWGGSGEPTRAALLCQARAFLNLMLMDRAWVRLKDVGERWPKDRTAKLLTAEMFIERGWPVRARRILEAIEDRRGVDELLELASEPPRQPPADARAIQESGTPEEQLKVAESFMAAGSFLRAKSILERLRRQKGPWAPRVSDLLWGVDGEFAKEEGDPGELARSLAPDLSTLDADDSSGSLEPSWADVTATGIVKPADDDDPDVAFPALFRRVDQLREAYATEEVTSVSHLASTAELLHRDDTEEADRPDQIMDVNPHARSADTQIMMVIKKTSDGPNHLRREETDELRETLNLRSYLSDMGMGASDLDSDADEVDLEEEDQDLVVVTRRETVAREPTEEVSLAQPIQVVKTALESPATTELEPLPESARAAMGAFDPVTVGEPAPPTRPRRRAPVEDDESEEIRPLGGYNARSRFIALLVVLLVLAGLTVRLGLSLAEGVAGNRVVDRTRSIVAAGDYQQLLSEEASLEARVAAGDSPEAHLEASYALVELILWAEYTGDAGRLQNATAALGRAEDHGGAQSIRQLAAGVKAYHQGDLDEAVARVADLDGAEANLLRARVLAARGDAKGAREQAGRAIEASPLARYEFGLAEVCYEAGDLDCASRAVDGALKLAPADPKAQLLRLVVDGAGVPPRERIKMLRPFLEGAESLPPRVAGQAYLAQSANLGRLGKTDLEARNLDKALSLDPGNPELQVWLAARYLSEGKALRALQVTEKVLQQRPSDADARAAYITVLLTLDRVEQARGALNGDEGVLKALVLLAEDNPEEAARVAQSVLDSADDPLGTYALGMAYGQLGRPVEATPLLNKASAALGESDDPYARLFAGRAAAAMLVYGEGMRPSEALYRSTDGEVLSLLGRYLDATGEDDRAAALHEQAAAAAPQSARVQYHRGLFYTDQQNGQHKQRVAWDAYLELGPSGARAQKVRERLGRR